MRVKMGVCLLIALAWAAAPAAVAQPLNNTSPAHAWDDPNPGEGPRRMDASLGAATAALKARRYHEASGILNEIVNAEARNPLAWRLLGVAYAGEGKWSASQRAYERVLKLAPDDILGHAGRGEALLAQKDPRAQDEAAWLKARTQACADTCPEAELLRTLAAHGPFAV